MVVPLKETSPPTDNLESNVTSPFTSIVPSNTDKLPLRLIILPPLTSKNP